MVMSIFGASCTRDAPSAGLLSPFRSVARCGLGAAGSGAAVAAARAAPALHRAGPDAPRDRLSDERDVSAFLPAPRWRGEDHLLLLRGGRADRLPGLRAG